MIHGVAAEDSDGNGVSFDATYNVTYDEYHVQDVINFIEDQEENPGEIEDGKSKYHGSL